MDKRYSKILVAKFSPQNGCHASEGEVLLLKPKTSIPMKNHVPHYFVSVQNPKQKSKYGWVKEVEDFSLGEFVEKYAVTASSSDEELNHISIMLQSIEKLPIDTPVAADYSKYGVIEQRMVLTVHKVFFYKEKPQ